MMNKHSHSIRHVSLAALSLLAWQLDGLSVHANPTGATVAQGAATFNTSGSQLTINTSANTLINWQSFNIGVGETTTFNQPSSSSVVWNHINDPNPSQILGNLNANGYVILQNQAGFYVGGSAAISAHGLVMTTSPTPAPNLSSGGAWEFDAPPPTVPIINYGQITINGGGSAYLIADSIQNNGTISAGQGSIGLYAGKQVLVSTSPDGRGLSAKVTLPQGSVDNEGRLIADGGTIAAQAQTVNQNGLVQANSVQNVNGVIELVASDNVNLAANSVISAQGAGTGVSSGGVVTIKSANTFSDQAGSAISIAGGAQGGNGGELEISAPNLGGIQSHIDGHAVSGFRGGAMTIDPTTITLDATQEGTYNQMIASGGLSAFTVSADDIIMSSSWALPASLSQLNLTANDTITVNTLWSLASAGVPSALTLSAGNNIVFNNSSGINAGNNWGVNLNAGTAYVAGQPLPLPGADGVYLNDNAHIQTQNGDIKVSAANEVQIANDYGSGSDGIRTLGGGSISVTTSCGDVNTGGNTAGFDFNTAAAPYYTIDSAVGGISTAAGGNVTINAGGNVYSYIPLGVASGGSTWSDAGTGAFGPEPGNVTITAGGGVFGHYVLANGTGAITANDGNVGRPDGVSFALSLINGSWNVNAPNGNIYLQEVRNPNGVFNNLLKSQGRGRPPIPGPGYYLFDYGAQAAVNLNAGLGVYLTDSGLPRLAETADIPALYPPILDITAGSGGVTLDGNVTLFPSADQNLTITTTGGGNLVALVPNTELLMSDSAQTRWIEGSGNFSDIDHGPLSAEPTDPTPVDINISGNMEDLALITTKETQINVGDSTHLGNIINCNFSGQNLHSSDVTSITANGQIYNQSAYTYVDGVNIPGIPAADLPYGAANIWDTIFLLAMDPTKLANLTIPANLQPSQYLSYALQEASLFGASIVNGQLNGSDQGFIYTPSTGRLWFGGSMSSSLYNELSGPMAILHLVNGLPATYADANGNVHFVTPDTYNWISPSLLSTLSTESQHAPSPGSIQVGYQMGGPGAFDITASSISLGNTYGILSCGAYNPPQGAGPFNRYYNLASITPASADINVTLTGPDQTTTGNVLLPDGTALSIAPHASLDMLTSTIATLGGGNVNVNSLNGSMDLGTSQTFNNGAYLGLGVYSAAGGDVTVKALGNVNIDGSRIATFDGGNVFVESLGGNVDVGSGGASQSGVFLTYDYNGIAGDYQEYVYGNGIVAYTLMPSDTTTLSGGLYNGYPPPGSSVTIAKVPGDITVETPNGNIIATLGGITQQALDGTTTAGPTITLVAGTPGGHVGNIDLGESGVIGGTVNATANGNITGLIISRQNSNVQASQNFSGSVLAGGAADVSGGGSVSGVIVGVGGASVSGGSVSAEVLSQNASVNGGASQSTLGTSATATSTSQSAAQQASSDTKQQIATNDNGSDDDNKKKKGPGLTRRVKRVTVILPPKA